MVCCGRQYAPGRNKTRIKFGGVDSAGFKTSEISRVRMKGVVMWRTRKPSST